MVPIYSSNWAGKSRKRLSRADVHKVPNYEVWLDPDVIGGEIYARSDNSS